MVYRLQIQRDPLPRTLHFEGLLDRKALEELLNGSRPGPDDRLVLHVGTEVTADCISALATAYFEVVAESPYLARWLETTRQLGGNR